MYALECVSVSGHDESPECRCGKKCTALASSHGWKEATRTSASTIVLPATMRCGLLFGAPMY